MKDNVRFERMAYRVKMIVYAAVMALLVLSASAHALTDESVLKMGGKIGTVPEGDCPYFLSPHFSHFSSDESIISSDTGIGNFSLGSILEVPIQLLNPQDIRYAEDKVDRCS